MNMNCKLYGGCLVAAFLKLAASGGENDWWGRRIAFLGDSITDPIHVGCSANYWNDLERDLGIVPLVYAVNGYRWKQIYDLSVKLASEHPDDVDAIMVFAGTNDYNANDSLGDWVADETTFRGRITRAMDYLTGRFPGVDIWLLTPLHRGYATFGAANAQPDERHANTAGLWLDSYVNVIREAAERWPAARLVDLNAESGIYPLLDSNLCYFQNPETDKLHPNNAGHERLAKVIARRLTRRDATAFVQSKISALPPEGGVVRLAKDTYHFYESAAQTMMLAPSNNQRGEKQVIIPLEGRKDVTIDGCGSTFVFHGRTFPFAAMNCKRLTFKNFTVTTRFPSCAGFVVTEKSDAGFTVRFDEGVCPYAVKDGNLTFTLDGHEVSTRDGRLSLHALDRLMIIYLMSPTAPGNKSEFPAGFVGVTPEIVGERLVRFTYYGDTHAKSIKLPYGVDERVVVNLEEKRYRDVFFFEDCEDVSVENVTIRRFGGMGVVAQRCNGVKVDGLVVEPPAGERVTITADVMQFVNCCGEVKVEHCRSGFSLDDVINIHGNYLALEGVKGREIDLRTKHRSHEGFFPYRPGDALEFITAHTREVLALAKVVAVAADLSDRSRCRVTVDADLPTLPEGTLVENVTLNPDVTIRENDFHDHPNLRLSGRGKLLVEKNRISRSVSALVVMDLADYWYESGRIAELTIRDNDFIDCNRLGGSTFLEFGVSGWGENAPKIHGRVRLENNRFEGVRGTRHRVNGVRDFTED